MEYLDFELAIREVSDGEYPVEVIRSPGGEARVVMRLPFDKPELENRLQALEDALFRSGEKRRRVHAPEQRTAQDFGQALFNSLLQGEVRSRYDVSLQRAQDQDKGLRLKIRIQPPDLATIPWEFLYDDRKAEYVALSRATPLIRFLDLPQTIEPLTVTPPLRILGMIASPTDLVSLDVEHEKQRVEEAIGDLREKGIVELKWLQGQTWADLQREMRRGPWHVFHFIGHCSYASDVEEGLIALANEAGKKHLLNATQLGRLLADHSALRFVLLNACEGARGAESEIFSSIAAVLTRRGVPAVIAMQYEITDRAATEFSHAFYAALADGSPVDTAITEARIAITLALDNSLEWGTPVLYSRAPDGVLFEITKREPAADDTDNGSNAFITTPFRASLNKLGVFLGGVVAVGGMVIAILIYWNSGNEDNKQASRGPVEITVLDGGSVTQKTITKTESLLGLWVAHPMEIYTDVSSIWLERKQSAPKNYYNPQVLDASVRFERADRKDELIANFKFFNEVFDHRFRAIVKVTDEDLWLLKTSHQKQYGAEPNLKVNMGEIVITESGMLRVDLKIVEYADITFYAKPDGA